MAKGFRSIAYKINLSLLLQNPFHQGVDESFASKFHQGLAMVVSTVNIYIYIYTCYKKNHKWN